MSGAQGHGGAGAAAGVAGASAEGDGTAEAALDAHLGAGVTTLCRCWRVTRLDGAVLGFTDHDGDLSFDGVTYRAARALTAGVAVSSLGLSVDNGAIYGALTGEAISEEDLRLGRFDGAEVVAFLVNWADPNARRRLFCGHIGNVTAGPAAFEAELRSAADRLNRPVGRSFGPRCDATLGDARCGVDLAALGRKLQATLAERLDDAWLLFHREDALPAGWFSHGVLRWTRGASEGTTAVIDAHELSGDKHLIRLATGLRHAVAPGDVAELTVGCDRSATCCAERFANIANFRGFPHLPGDDWLTATPKEGALHDGGRRR